MTHPLRYALAAFALFVSSVSAHEVNPAIGDIGITDGALQLALTINGEALVAGVDIDGIQDTDELDSATELDALRELAPEDLAERLGALLPEFASDLALLIDGEPTTLTPLAIVVDDVPNVNLPRDTALAFTAPWPSGAESFSLTWPTGMGALVLRQQGVDDPFTGFLNGGDNTGPIAVGNAAESSGWFSRWRSYLFDD